MEAFSEKKGKDIPLKLTKSNNIPRELQTLRQME
jgi:hypothetical protein